MSGMKGRSGGPRKGAGRPRKKKTINEKVRAVYMKAARELAKEFGEPLEKAVLRLAYLDNVQDSVKVAILKAYNEALLVKESEQNVNVNRYPAPAIYLPALKEDPALRVVKGGKGVDKSSKKQRGFD